jgi:hypothetical protein
MGKQGIIFGLELGSGKDGDTLNTIVPIPGYENYKISLEGNVYNSRGHMIKPTRTFFGDMVELRRYGQRERLYVSDILKQVKRQEENVASQNNVQNLASDGEERT